MGMKTKFKLENSGYYLLGLIVLVILGFWNSYFSKLFTQTDELNIYFHFHAVIAFLWILIVIVQPFLIKRGDVNLHRKIGKLSYVLIALVFISVLLLAHSRHTIDEEGLGLRLLVPFKDLIILGIVYAIAMWNRKTTPIHARAMIASGIVFIEPALIRVIRNFFEVGAPYMVTVGIVYLLLLILTVVTWKYKKGRWVFPLVLIMYLVVHMILMFRVQIGLLENFAKWFIQLPLT